MERDYLADNDAERGRLDALAARLSDDDLRRTLDNGMTVAAALVHVAFWDEYSLALLDQWERTGFATARSDYNAVNAAVGCLASAVPVAAASEIARTAAQRVDQKVLAVPDDLASTIELNSHDFALRRATHRRVHLDQIERALTGRG